MSAPLPVVQCALNNFKHLVKAILSIDEKVFLKNHWRIGSWWWAVAITPGGFLGICLAHLWSGASSMCSTSEVEWPLSVGLYFMHAYFSVQKCLSHNGFQSLQGLCSAREEGNFGVGHKLISPFSNLCCATNGTLMSQTGNNDPWGCHSSLHLNSACCSLHPQCLR